MSDDFRVPGFGSDADVGQATGNDSKSLSGRYAIAEALFGLFFLGGAIIGTGIFILAVIFTGSPRQSTATEPGARDGLEEIRSFSSESPGSDDDGRNDNGDQPQPAPQGPGEIRQRERSYDDRYCRSVIHAAQRIYGPSWWEVYLSPEEVAACRRQIADTGRGVLEPARDRPPPQRFGSSNHR